MAWIRTKSLFTFKSINKKQTRITENVQEVKAHIIDELTEDALKKLTSAISLASQSKRKSRYGGSYLIHWDTTLCHWFRSAFIYSSDRFCRGLILVQRVALVLAITLTCANEDPCL